MERRVPSSVGEAAAKSPAPKKTAREEGGGLYFKPTSSLRFISSGSTLLDCVNGGGWPLGRMTNIIGDKSTGKTLLGIEAFANCANQYPKGRMFYRESEAAFDIPYAKSIGLPVDRVDFGPKGHRWKLIEEIFQDLKKQTAECTRRKEPGLYIIDSMDALTTQKDLDKDFGAQDYPSKPRELSELFRKVVADVEDAQMALLIISQVRTNIGVTFGDKTTRTGGKALDFYASLINKLAHMKQIKQTIKGVERVTAVRVRAKNTKNKVGEAFGECEFTIRFGYGINDTASCLEWLLEVKRQTEVDPSLTQDKAKKLLGYLNDLDKLAIDEWGEVIRQRTKEVWADIESQFRPTITKY